MPLYSIIEGAGDGSTTENGIPNVSQYGWSSYEVSEYKQLIEYVDEARKYAESIKGVAEFALAIQRDLIELKAEVDAMAADLRLDYDEAQRLYAEIKVYHTQITEIDARVIALAQQVTVDATDVRDILAQVTALRNEVLTLKASVEASERNAASSATAAQVAETGAEDYFNKSYDLYLDLKKGQVYRGPWNPNSGAYPTDKTTNSVWDVILNEGQQEHTFDGKRWFWGDRLIYVKAEDKFYQIEAGTSVKSVNGKAGAVVLTSADVGAVSKAGDTMTGALKTTVSEPTAFIAERNGAQAIFGCSQIKGEFLFGGRQTLNGDLTQYIRMGVGKFRWNNAGAEHDIYHAGNKPTALALNVLNAHVSTVTTQNWNTLTQAGSYRVGNANGANFPAISGLPAVYNYGSLLVQNASGVITQLYISNRSPAVFTRTKYDANAWSGWATTGTSTSITINSSIDLDDYSSGGTYNMYRGAGVTFTNAPDDFDFGTLQVIGRGRAGGSFVTQILTWRADNARQMIRTRNDGTFTWGPWRKIYSSGQKPTPEDIGALPVSGGVLTNQITAAQSQSYQVKLGSTANGVGILALKSDGTRYAGGMGVYSEDGGTNSYNFIGWGSTPWLPAHSLTVSSGEISYKGNLVYHQGYKPTAADVGADPTGTAAALISKHKAEASAHTPQKVGADPSGTAAALMSQHKSEASAHTPQKVGADPAGTAAKAITALKAETNPFPQYSDFISGEPRIFASRAQLAKRATQYHPLDGQLVPRSSDAGLLAAIIAGEVPSCTDAEWLADKSKRGMYTLGDDATNIRLPDWNGKSTDSLGAPVIRGDGKNADAAGLIQGDCIRNITGSVRIAAAGKFSVGTEYAHGVIGLGSEMQVISGATGLTQFAQSSGFTIDASRTVPTGVENRMINTSGVHAVKR